MSGTTPDPAAALAAAISALIAAKGAPVQSQLGDQQKQLGALVQAAITQATQIATLQKRVDAAPDPITEDKIARAASVTFADGVLIFRPDGTPLIATVAQLLAAKA